MPCPLKFIMVNEASADTKIRVESVSKSFDVDGRRQLVLDDINLAVGEGEFVSIIGPSGCGKSTLLNIVAGLDSADSGTTSVEGTQGSSSLGQVGYMQQKDLLLPWRTVLDNTILGLELAGVPKRQARSRALELTETFGLDGFEGQYPYALSGGMRQRAAFLRTMLMDQEVILLDEPFGALDALTRVQMQEWLLQLWDSLRKTIVLITHDMDEAILLSDRVYVLTPRPGRIATILEVDLPRPRSYEQLTEPAFSRLKSRLLKHLREKKPEEPQSLTGWVGF
ncbi:MAG: ABC transporter ATP-binding protein [Chloroflexota bacterium]|nr:ABC transporter ATP-binding protein [Chloroflexota bacterium]MEC9288417.1 ABC transporter ATP-binding protein [Chloroflexota bacterium]